MRKVNDDAREESRLRHSQQEARDVKLQRRAHERSQRRYKTPRDENARKPFTGAPMLDQERAGNFQDEIAEEEDAETQPEHLLGKLQVAGHAQLGEADIGAIEVGDNVDCEHQRQHAPGDLASERGGIDRTGSHGPLKTAAMLLPVQTSSRSLFCCVY